MSARLVLRLFAEASGGTVLHEQEAYIDNTASWSWQQLALGKLATVDCWAEVYVENLAGVPVWFDDLEIAAGGQPVALVVQETHYDPWGLELAGIGYVADMSKEHKFTYNGKEKQDQFGLGWLDYGARHYQADIGRWGGVDALAAKYLSFSPYVYVLNRPTIGFDPDGKRTFFSAGAGHDPDNTGYIDKILYAFAEHGKIRRTVDINAHAAAGLGFIPSDALWAIGEYREKPYYDLQRGIPAGMGGMIVENVSDETVNWRIRSNVDQITSELKDNPLEKNEQFNLSGYSTGSVIMAQSALMLAKKGHVIDNLVLIGATFDKNSELYKALTSNKNIKQVIRIDIPGDNVIEGLGALQSFLEKGDDHPHFSYAFGKNADENRKALALILQSLGVKDYNDEKK